MAVNEIGGHGAGQFSGRGAAHAVGHHEQRPPGADLVAADIRLKAGVPGAQIGDEKGVLVVFSGTAEIGLAEHGDAHWGRAHALLE